MNRTVRRLLPALSAALLLVSVGATAAYAQGTAFTYQGELKNSGNLVNVPVDFQFSVWTAPTGGTQFAAPVVLTNVNVDQGRFTVPIDFGVNPFTSSQNIWLQTAVSVPAGSENYLPMGTRQLLTPAPFSLATRGINVDNFGRVTLNPTGPGGQNDQSFIVNAANGGMLQTLTVSNGGVQNRMETTLDASGSGNPGAGFIRMHTPGVGYGPLTLNETMTLVSGRNTGNVGIGTNAPARLLHLKGLNPGIMFQDTADEAAPNGRWAIDTQAFGLPGIALVRYPSDGVASMGRSLFVNTNGQLGLGANPTARFHIQRDTAPTLPSGTVPFNQTMVVAAGDASIGLYSTSGGTFGARYELKEVNSQTGAFVNGWSMSRRTTNGGSFLNWTFGTNTDSNGNPIKLQLDTNGTLAATGCVIGTNVACPSAARFKENVEIMRGSLESVMQLRGVTFDWKAEEAKKRGFTHDIGFIAEEVQQVFPSVVLKDADGQVLGVDYARLTSVAVEAIKQLKVEADAKQTKIDELNTRLEKLEELLGQSK